MPLPSFPKLTILISSAGRRVALLETFRTAAKELNIDLRIIAVDLDPAFSAACQAADAACTVPRCTSPDFIPALKTICLREQVSLVIPTIDTELVPLAEAANEFAKIQTRVVVSDRSLVETARDKEKTARLLASNRILTPRTAEPSEVLSAPDQWRWPLILKPRGGSSSMGIRVCPDFKGFESSTKERGDYIVQEFWKGREFTINLFFDQAGALRSVVPHLRKETRGGEVSKAVTTRDPVLMALGENVGAALQGAMGPLCFQAIQTDAGETAVFEINARFGGGYPVAHHAGAKFSKWLLEEAAGRQSTASNIWRDGVRMLRYDAAVFPAEQDQGQAQPALRGDEIPQVPNALV